MKTSKRGFRNEKYAGSTKKTALGQFIHRCGQDFVLKVISADVPYPNSPVLMKSGERVGSVDEVFGSFDEVYLSFVADSKNFTCGADEVFFAFEDKFIKKERFLSRKDMEEKKERDDKHKKSASRPSKVPKRRRD